jgi:tetratricopeptide (TPR) repeat protein
LVWEKIPFFALAAVSSIITFLVQRTSGAMVGINTLSFNKRVANVFLSYVQYISKMFWPSNLAVSYPFDARSIPFGQAAICALLLLVISFFVIRLGRSQKYLPMGWFWFVITFIPVIGIVQVGGQAYADRYTYIPYIGLFIMLAWGLPQFLSKLPQRKIILGVSMVIVLTTLGIFAHRQVSYWKNSLTLFSHALAVTQNNCLAYNNIGLAYNDIGRTAEAIDAYKQAIKIKPNYESAYNNLGVVYGNLGRGIDSIDAYKQAIKFKPDYAMAYYNLGLACGNLHRWSEAMDALKQAVKIKPDLAEGYYNLGYVYLVTGDKKSALAEYNILKSLNPQSAEDLFKQINK